MITPEEAVDAINDRFGRHEGYRGLHAKGVLMNATFTATPEAARLTRAGHMQGDPVPAIVRFSNGSGDPNDPDYAPDVRGMAVKFTLPDGSRTDISAQTAPRFPFRTPDAFIELTMINPRSIGALWRLPVALAKNPGAVRTLRENLAALKPPASFATVRYYAVHAYHWVDAEGERRAVRYRWLPQAGVEHISPGDGKKRGRDYLHEEIVERAERGEARFDLELQIAAPGDPTDDPTAAWPDDRERVIAGTLEVTGRETEREQGDDVVVFDPTRVVDGIELSDDPILRYRSPAYSASIKRRSGRDRPATLEDVSGPR